MTPPSEQGSLGIPDRLRVKVSGMPGGRPWLAALPTTCGRLAEEWSLELGEPFPDCHVSFVLPVRQQARSAVLKVPLPQSIELGTLAGDQRRREHLALRAWDGRGAVRLLAYDPATGAMLQERCSPGDPLDVIDDSEADRIAAELMQRLHLRPDPFWELSRLTDLATAAARVLADRFDAAGAPFDPALIGSAVDRLRHLAGDPADQVLLHGDFQHANVLAADREPWLAIDPLPMIGEPAYDAVQYLLLRKGDLADPASEWPSVIDTFCARLGVDPDRALEWTFVRMITDAVAACSGPAAPPAGLEAHNGMLWTARLADALLR